MGARERTAREQALLARANDHFGLLHHDHLVEAGLGRGAIRSRLASGRLTEIHHCVYAFGHTALRDEARWLAALWTLGRSTWLSHLGAAASFGWRALANDEDVHVSTTRALGDRKGITVHRVRSMDRRDVFHPPRFAVTSMPRTLVDLADVLPWPEYRALADGLPGLRVDRIREAQARAPFRVGSPKVTRLIEADQAHTRSEFERRYLRFSRAHGLPRPSGLNVPIAGHTADCVYGAERLVVELDGRAYHRRRAQMRADRRRDTDYQLAGHLILRLVWDDLHPDEAEATARRIRKMLAVARP